MNKHVQIEQISSGVPGLDAVLGGGFPEFSFNLIAGAPGGGKTTLAHQIMFAGASPERPALYITVVGEPPIKMLRYQQQYSFFDPDKIPSCVRFLHLAQDMFEGGLVRVLETISREVEATQPKLVFVDSFRALVTKSNEVGQMDLQAFIQRLSLQLTSMEATTFLIGEYEDREAASNPIFTVADGLLWLSQVPHQSSVVRKLQVMKMRGQESIPGLHTVNISADGLRVHPRIMPMPAGLPVPNPRERRKTGVAGLDEMMGGGIPSGYSMMIVGPPGSGKSTLATQFILEGIQQGEAGIIVEFEKTPAEYLALSAGLSARPANEKLLQIIQPKTLDLSADEALDEMLAAVHAAGARRVVIDSLSGFELALAPGYRAEFRESLHRVMGSLTSLGVTVLMTAEVIESSTELRLSPHSISFLTDGIILQRYVEQHGLLRKMLAVVKLRGFDHSKQLRFYEIGAGGMVLDAPPAAKNS